MVPWSIKRVAAPPPNAKLLEMQTCMDWCNSLRPPRQVFLTKPQCHNYPNKCFMRALCHPCTSLYDCCRVVKVPLFLPMNGTVT